MDKIIMNHLAFYGFHGVMDEEKVLGQKFYVDIELLVDLSLAGTTDLVENTVSYADVYDDVKYFVESARYNLIEALGENICNMLLAKYPLIEEAMVRIKKPEAPIRGIFDFVGVEIRRGRHA